MTEAQFVSLMNGIIMLGQKDSRTKEEALTYEKFLAYAGSISSFNRLIVEDAINEKLDNHDLLYKGSAA